MPLPHKVRIFFWWVGEEENWENVFCPFENNAMIAKGQVGIITKIDFGLLLAMG